MGFNSKTKYLVTKPIVAMLFCSITETRKSASMHACRASYESIQLSATSRVSLANVFTCSQLVQNFHDFRSLRSRATRKFKVFSMNFWVHLYEWLSIPHSEAISLRSVTLLTSWTNLLLPYIQPVP